MVWARQRARPGAGGASVAREGPGKGAAGGQAGGRVRTSLFFSAFRESRRDTPSAISFSLRTVSIWATFVLSTPKSEVFSSCDPQKGGHGVQPPAGDSMAGKLPTTRGGSIEHDDIPPKNAELSRYARAPARGRAENAGGGLQGGGKGRARVPHLAGGLLDAEVEELPLGLSHGGVDLGDGHPPEVGSLGALQRERAGLGRKDGTGGRFGARYVDEGRGK